MEHREERNNRAAENVKCLICNVEYSRNYILRHKRRIHHVNIIQGKKKCIVCNLEFKRGGMLLIHQRNIHHVNIKYAL